MNRSDIPFHSAAELGELIGRREVSSVEAAEAHFERIDAVDGALNSYITVCRDEALRAAEQADRDIAGGRAPRAPPRRALRRQGPVLEQGRAVHRRLRHPQRLRPRRRLHRGGAPQAGGRNTDRQAQHERVRHRQQLPAPGRYAPQSMGPGAEPRHLQRRFGGRHRGLPLRNVAGRGHWRLDKEPRQQLRGRRAQANVGTGEPVRPDGRILVDGHRRPHNADGRRLRHHPSGHSGSRPQRPLHVESRRPGLPIGPERRDQGGSGRRGEGGGGGRLPEPPKSGSSSAKPSPTWASSERPWKRSPFH